MNILSKFQLSGLQGLGVMVFKGLEEKDDSLNITVSQVAPSWCLHSSTYQFGNGTPKARNLWQVFRSIQQLKTSTRYCGVPHKNVS